MNNQLIHEGVTEHMYTKARKTIGTVDAQILNLSSLQVDVRAGDLLFAGPGRIAYLKLSLNTLRMKS